MELTDAIRARTSIRGYKSTPVPRELITEILDTAHYSPSSSNSQPWEFVVVTGDVLKELKHVNFELLTSNTESDSDIPINSKRTGRYRDRQISLGKEIFRRQLSFSKKSWMKIPPTPLCS